MVFVCAPSNPLAARPELSIHELDGRAFIGFDERLRIRNEIDKALAAQDVAVRVVMEFDNIETLKRAVEIDAGVTLLPAPTVTREIEVGTLCAIPLSDVHLVRPLSIIQRRGAELGRTARRFIELLQQQTDSTPAVANGHAKTSKKRKPRPAKLPVSK
jgi:DNA-binding transcriptional LysR family regulator